MSLLITDMVNKVPNCTLILNCCATIMLSMLLFKMDLVHRVNNGQLFIDGMYIHEFTFNFKLCLQHFKLDLNAATFVKLYKL